MKRDIHALRPVPKELKTEYLVVEGISAGDITERINYSILDGWKVDGNIVLSHGGTRTLFAQRLIKQTSRDD